MGLSRAELEFPSLKKDGDKDETRFGFVVANGQMGIAAVSRQRVDGKVTGEVQVLKAVQNRPAIETIRKIPLAAEPVNGPWTFSYRRGVVAVRQGGKEVARGYVEGPDFPLLGVVWSQEAGSVACKGLRLAGAPAPAPRPDAEQKQLQEAARLNQEGVRLYREGKIAEALTPTREASALYLKVLGEDHHDTANSFTNIATLLEKQKDYDGARAFYEKALKVRKKVLGADHPQAALVLMNLENLMMMQEKAAEARPYYAACLAAYEQVYGKEAQVTKNLSDLVARLPGAPR